MDPAIQALIYIVDLAYIPLWVLLGKWTGRFSESADGFGLITADLDPNPRI